MEAYVSQLLIFLATGIDACIGLIIAFAVLEAVGKAVTSVFTDRKNFAETRATIRLMLSKWLALSLEFALAADILRSVVAPTWDDVGKLAAIVAIRTAINYFLEREIEQASKNQEDAP